MLFKKLKSIIQNIKNRIKAKGICKFIIKMHNNSFLKNLNNLKLLMLNLIFQFEFFFFY